MFVWRCFSDTFETTYIWLIYDIMYCLKGRANIGLHSLQKNDLRGMNILNQFMRNDHFETNFMKIGGMIKQIWPFFFWEWLSMAAIL